MVTRLTSQFLRRLTMNRLLHTTFVIELPTFDSPASVASQTAEHRQYTSYEYPQYPLSETFAERNCVQADGLCTEHPCSCKFESFPIARHYLLGSSAARIARRFVSLIPIHTVAHATTTLRLLCSVVAIVLVDRRCECRWVCGRDRWQFRPCSRFAHRLLMTELPSFRCRPYYVTDGQ